MKKESEKTKKIDYCGPEKNPFLAYLIPDRIAFVDFSDCCKDHDEDYKRGGDEKQRKKDDKRFKTCLKCRVKKTVGWLRQWLYRPFVFIYWRAVRRGGKGYYNYRKSSVSRQQSGAVAGVSSEDQSRRRILRSEHINTGQSSATNT
ncbi:MAG: hypothetical protein NE327_06360 [Lentisphaeraceae bacterium]|nr:hypothetical protein [Lentisphaeraceae bacterium]